MLIYLNEHKHGPEFEAVPAVLREKYAAKMQQDWEKYYRITFIVNGPGVLQADIRNSDRELLQQFFESSGIAAVSLEAADVSTLMGRNPASLMLVDLLNSSEKARELCSALEPSEIFPLLEQIAWETVAPKPNGILDALRSPVDEAVTVQRMKDAGFHVPEAQSLELPAERQPTTEFDEEFGLIPLPPDHDLFSAVLPSLGGEF
jgi:hypothetical protein